MADFCDDANAISSLYLAAALSDATFRRAGHGPIWIDGEPFCKKCEAAMSIKRVEAVPGVELCIECAEEAEDNGRSNKCA